LDKKKVQELIKIMKDNDLSEVTIEEGGEKITVRQGNITIVEGDAAAEPAYHPARSPVTHVSGQENEGGDPEMEAKYLKILSPMVGTFYRAPAPGADAFVEDGEIFEKGATLCVIEAMKLMNEITAEEKGRLIKGAVPDGDPVEFGQTLLYFEPVA
jgi:acetyl-CoA carboxylase biotin carboxyl carrier protein